MAQPTPSELAAEKAAAACELALMFRIFLLFPGPKRPMLEVWGTVATNRRETIEKWVSTRPGIGLAIRCGALANGDQFFVVDVDEHHAEASGNATIDMLEDKHGPLPQTIEAATPRSETGLQGRHLFFRVPNGWPTPRNDAGRLLGPGLDVGDGRKVRGVVACGASGSPAPVRTPGRVSIPLLRSRESSAGSRPSSPGCPDSAFAVKAGRCEACYLFRWRNARDRSARTA